MVWIKRNLFFVISAAVGVVLVGCAGYFLYTSINQNSAAKEELNSAVSDLQNLQNKPAFPSKENIQTAKEQQQQVKELLAGVKNTFASFPVPAKTDERGFKSLLDKSLAQLQQEATNAGVGLVSHYAFGFSSITTKLNFPSQNIVPWMEQLQEIQSICGVLFSSKINFLERIRRVSVGNEDESGVDYLAAESVTNQYCISTPYEITFRAFSGEIASVLDGFQRATNCFVVKNIDVQPSSKEIETGPADSSASPAYNGRGRPFNPQQAPANAARYGAPVTILSERPLQVTLLVDVIKLKLP